MKLTTLIFTISVACTTAGFADPITYDFQSVPVGGLGGGFLTLTVGGVNAFFSGSYTTVDVNPFGTHVLRTGDYHSQMGIQLSVPVSKVVLTVDGYIPTTSNSVSVVAYEGLDYVLRGIPPVPSSGSTLVFNAPPNAPGGIIEVLLDGNSGNGYSLDNVSILVPEPASATLFFSAAALALVRRRNPSGCKPASRA